MERYNFCWILSLLSCWVRSGPSLRTQMFTCWTILQGIYGSTCLWFFHKIKTNINVFVVWLSILVCLQDQVISSELSMRLYRYGCIYVLTVCMLLWVAVIAMSSAYVISCVLWRVEMSEVDMLKSVGECINVLFLKKLYKLCVLCCYLQIT